MTTTLPLIGIRILVTRSRHQAGKLSSKLTQLGGEPIEIPVIEIGQPDSWEPLDAALDQITEYDWILFASVNAVDGLLDRFESFGRTVDELARVKMAAIGPVTADALVERGLTAAFSPSQFIAEALVAQFPGYPNLKGKRMLWPRTNIGRGYIVDKLTEAGAELDLVPAYTTSEPADAKGAAQRLVSLLKNSRLDIITLTSAQCATNLAKLLSLGLAESTDGSQPTTIGKLLANVKIATIGPETSGAALKALGKANIEASQHTLTGIVDALVSHFRAAKH